MSDPDLERVKQILVGDIRASLDKLQSDFESDVFADRVADVVAEALSKRSSKDDQIADVLAPTIDQAIAGSINQDPKKLAESLYPIMGPAIRKSISETLQQMLENFNQLLEESLSPQSLRWRFDAWRTGKSYSELVMLNTLEYRIEQVFLIHRETSLLIQHQLSDLADAKDPDMVSSMFSAIQDFIEDSFATDDTNELNTLRLGDLTVMIQRGPSAVLAAVVRGRVPENLRSQMIEMLEGLHLQKRPQLLDYSGDPDDFIDVEPEVRELLHAEKKEQEEVERKIPWLAIVSIVIVLAGFGYWQWIASNIAERQGAMIAMIEAEPGTILLDADQSREKLVVELLRDPDARLPNEYITEPDPEDRFAFQFEFRDKPFLSLDSEILLQRVTPVIQPEQGVELEVVGQVLFASGSSSKKWFEKAQTKWQSTPGLVGFDTSELNVVDYEFEEMQSLVKEIESFSFEFERGEAEIDVEGEKFQALLLDLLALVDKSERLGVNVRIDIVGFTDASGTDRVNRIIGKSRAAKVAVQLIERGVPEWILSTYHSQEYEGVLGSDRRETRLIVSIGQDAT